MSVPELALVAIRVVITASPGEVRAAALDASDRLIDLAIWRPAVPDGVGDLYAGRISEHVNALAGSFVALGGALSGFLPDREGGALPEGTRLVVRIARAAQGGKGPRLSAELAPDERAVAPTEKLGRLLRGPNPVVRLARAWPEAQITIDEAEAATALGSALSGRIERGAGFEPALEAEIAALGAPEVVLDQGARLTIEPTRALVAIDVDAAQGLGSGGAHEAHRAINRAAIPEIARQIRLRNLSGMILVDLAGESVRARRRFAPLFAAALAPDPIGPRFVGFTTLGLAEILRPRLAPPLFELLAGSYAAGLAALRAALYASLAEPAVHWQLRAAPAVVSALEHDPAALAALARRTGRTLPLVSDTALEETAWTLERGG